MHLTQFRLRLFVLHMVLDSCLAQNVLSREPPTIANIATDDLPFCQYRCSILLSTSCGTYTLRPRFLPRWLLRTCAVGTFCVYTDVWIWARIRLPLPLPIPRDQDVCLRTCDWDKSSSLFISESTWTIWKTWVTAVGWNWIVISITIFENYFSIRIRIVNLIILFIGIVFW